MISHLGVCTESEISYFEKLTKEIGKLVQDDETFKLLVLVLLFSDVDESPKLTNLRNTYLNVIQRRQDHINSYQQNHGSLCVGSSVYSKFNSSIASLKELSVFIQRLLKGPPK